MSDTLCVENGLSIIEKPQHTTLTYDKWLGDRAKQPQREEMRATIDEIMRQKPESFDALLSVLREKGWEIKHGKRMSARAPGQIRFKRLDSLGEEYSEKTLHAALDEKREWKPKERRKGQKPKIEHTSVSLLVDVQAKLQQGKGGGYARWAKVFNAKQMAQTLTYLSEHHIQNLSELAEKTKAATLRHGELLKKMKNEEAQIREVAELKKHVLGYLRTHEIYVRNLQTRLNYLGYNAGSVDGRFGTNTKNAVMALQQNAGAYFNLAVDGKVGDQTKEALTFPKARLV